MPVAYLDSGAIYRQANARFAAAIGTTPERLLGQHASFGLDPAVGLAHAQRVVRALQGRPPSETAGLHVPDAPPVAIEFRYLSDRLDDGSVAGVHVIGVDVTERRTWTRRLAEREAFLRDVIDGSLNFLGVLTPDGILVDVNQPALDVAALAREDVVGRPFWECHWWNYGDEAVQERLKHALQDARRGEQVRYDVDVRTIGDERITIDFQLSSVRDQDGDVTFLVPTGVDITARVKARAAAEKDRTQLDMAMRAARMGAFSWNRSTDVLQADENWFDLLGLRPGDVNAGNDVFPFIIDEDVPEVWKAIDGSRDAREAYETFFRIVPPDGRMRWIAAAGQWIDDGNDPPELLMGLNWDVTAQKENEVRERLERERLSIAAAAAGFGTFQLDLVEGTVEWSPEFKALVGMDPDAPVTIGPGDLPDFIHPDDREDVEEHVRGVLARPDAGDHCLEHRIVLPDGAVRHVRLQSRSLGQGDSDHGPPRVIVGTLLDITEERQHEQALELERQAADAANHAKSEFLANMSHEIRTPLSAIVGHTDILVRHLSDPDNLHSATVIKRNAGHLLELVNDILDLSRIEAHRMDVDVDDVALAELFSDLRALMEVRLEGKDVALRIRAKGALPARITTDVTRVRQILINIIGNAIKFTEKGAVEVTAHVDGGQLRIDVEDSGIGISAEAMARIFEPFDQGDASRTRQFGGTGLGLAISRRLARILGGELRATSVEGVGSTFTLRLPLSAEELARCEEVELGGASGTAAPAEAAGAEELHLDGHLLLVDDRRDIRQIGQYYLEEAGATVVTAADGIEAIERYEAALASGAPFDAIVMDMHMPRMDGATAVGKLREMGCTTPILALTADAMKQDRDRYIDAGCDDHLAKPVEADDLIAALMRLLG